MPHALTELDLAEVTGPPPDPRTRSAPTSAWSAPGSRACRRPSSPPGCTATWSSSTRCRSRRPDGAFADRAVLRSLRQRPGYRQLTHGISDDISATWGQPATCISSPATPRPSTTTRWPSAAGSSGRSGARRHADPRHRAATGRPETGGSPRSSSPPATATSRIAAHGFVDASGDAALTWQAGLPCRVPERPIYGSQLVIVENVDEATSPDAARSPRCWPPAATSTGCSAATGSPSSSPAGAPP